MRIEIFGFFGYRLMQVSNLKFFFSIYTFILRRHFIT